MFQFAKLVPLIVFLLPLAASAQKGVSSPDSATNDPMLRPVAADRNLTLLSIRDATYGTRLVSYFVVDDMAIIDGDIIYGPVEKLRAQDVRRNPQVEESRAFSISSNTWPSANITYRYESDATATLLIPIIDAAIARWRSTAPYLTFTRLTPNNATAANGVATIKAPECGGCSSHVGYSSSSPRTVNLQQSCSPSGGHCGVAEATHELGHLLGLYHEHQRPDRETTVHYQCENVNPKCPSGTSMPAGKTCCDTGLPTGCCHSVGNFNINTSTSRDSAGPYDVTSIMQYSSKAFAISGTKTLVPAAAGVVIPSSNPSNPSARDYDRICKLYKTKCPKAISCTTAGCPAQCTVVDQACLDKRAQCTSLGCDFLTQ